MKVTGCNNCPFRIDKYDGWSTGFDSLAYCQLAKFNRQPDWIITAYYAHNEPEIITPNWCPLQEITITKVPRCRF